MGNKGWLRQRSAKAPQKRQITTKGGYFFEKIHAEYPYLRSDF